MCHLKRKITTRIRETEFLFLDTASYRFEGFILTTDRKVIICTEGVFSYSVTRVNNLRCQPGDMYIAANVRIYNKITKSA